MSRSALRIATAIVAAALVAPAAAQIYPGVQPLLQTSSTVAGEKIAWPAGAAKATSTIVTIAPGEKTARHTHPEPLYVYILAGEVTVDYEGIGTKSYKAGDAFMEAMGVTHQARNDGAVPVRILTVTIGVDGGFPTRVAN